MRPCGSRNTSKMDTANAGHMMSLAALQRQDPYINKLLDVTGQVALYNFNSKSNEWEKTEIEGTLFVYERSASPHHGFTIMNRLSTENLVEPINKDLEFQLQDPFLLYRNGNLGIYSIWFYDKKDCQRIAQLMVKIVKQEADHAQRRSPDRMELRRTNGVAEPRPTDILELLSKAKEEYHRAQVGDADVSTDAKVQLPAEKKMAKSEKSTHTVVKQITVEELFGSSLPKDPSLPAMPSQNTVTASSDPSPVYLQKQSYPTPVHQNPLLPPHFKSQGPGSDQRLPSQGLLPVPFTLHPSTVFQPVGVRPEPQSLCSAQPVMVPTATSETLPGLTGPAAPPADPGAYFGQEILNALKPSAQPVNSDFPKPILAPSFLPSTLVPPQNFQEPMSKPVHTPGKDLDPFCNVPSLIKPMPALPVNPSLPGSEMSVLLSPSAFQQANSKAAVVVPPVPSELPTTSLGALDPQKPPCSRTQLQETLIHLLKNDPDFVDTIHDAYIRSISKDFSNIKL
ncbi:mRNA-decapping enzyme 1A [Synchiropus picturatus]